MKIRINKSYQCNNNSIRFIVEENKIMISITDIFYYLDGKKYNYTGCREILSSLKRCFSKCINNNLSVEIENNEVKNIWLESSLAIEYAQYISEYLGEWCYSIVDRLEKEKSQLFSEAKLLVDDTPLRLSLVSDLVKEIKGNSCNTQTNTSSNKNFQVIVDDMPNNGNTKSFNYNQLPVSFFFCDTEVMINISDMSKVSDIDIQEWFNLDKTVQLIDSYKKRGRLGITRKETDSESSTIWMCEELSLNLAFWISSDFGSWCGSRVKDMVGLDPSKE